MVNSTLYTIKHKVLPIVYIGISVDVDRRFNEHKNSSSNSKLKRAILEYGVDSFVFKRECTGIQSLIEELELLCIQEAKTLGRIILCNVMEGSPNIGCATNLGTMHWNAKLTEQDVEDIRFIYSQGGITQKQIGEIYGLSNKVISKITTGSRWRSVGGPSTVGATLKINRACNKAKIDRLSVPSIREEACTLLSEGLSSVQEIAYKYKISRGSMRFLLTGRSYVDEPGPLLNKDYFIK